MKNVGSTVKGFEVKLSNQGQVLINYDLDL